jgi:hypothetical protein
VAEDLEEVEVAEVAGVGLGQAGIEGFQHAGQLLVFRGYAAAAAQARA